MHSLYLMQIYYVACLMPSDAPSKTIQQNNCKFSKIQKCKMQATAKKCRQRNRPRNKANRIVANEVTENGNECTCLESTAIQQQLPNPPDEIDGVQAKFLANVLQNILQADKSPLTKEELFEESSDEEDYVEYIVRPRDYFLISLCNLCKLDIGNETVTPCSSCKMVYYCSTAHMKSDKQHKELCRGLRRVAETRDGHIFYKCGVFTTEQFRDYRILVIRELEAVLNRSLTATEREVVLFPKICNNIQCRENNLRKLSTCNKCGEVAFCKDRIEHLSKTHLLWCDSHRLFKSLIVLQNKCGQLNPPLPTTILDSLPTTCSNTAKLLQTLQADIPNPCMFAVMTQIATGPLTAWYALKLCEALQKSDTITIHLIGAEIDFEVAVVHKWEAFFLHIAPNVQTLNVVFIGPELNSQKVAVDTVKQTKCCRICNKSGRSVKYHFEDHLYHDYCKLPSFIRPDLICFYNAGLYRSTGYFMEDTWPETIHAAAALHCPIVVTAYTEYEVPLDMQRFIYNCDRHVTVVLPPTMNPFTSTQPERNFISEEIAPFIFKNYFCFVIE